MEIVIRKYGSIKDYVYTKTESISINEYRSSSFVSNYDINMIRLYDKALSEEEVVSNYNYQQTLI